MEVTLSVQTQGFLLSCVVGFALGILYDVLRIIRVFFKSDNRHIFVMDIVFMACAAIISFLLALAINWGEIRFFILAGEGIGFCIYYLTIGEVTIRIVRFLCKILGHVFRFIKKKIMKPIIGFFTRISKNILIKCKKTIESSKKSCANRKKNLKPHSNIVYNLFKGFCKNRNRKAGRRHHLNNEGNQKEKAKT